MTKHADDDRPPLGVDFAWAQRLARRVAAEGLAGEDALQDTWVAVLSGRAAGVRAPERWFATVLRNFARGSKRSADARRRTERGAARNEGAGAASEEPNELVARAELLRRVVDAVLELDEPYRATLLAHYLDGLSAEEIARREGLAGSTVRTRLQRGLARLRQHFGTERGLFARLPYLGLPQLTLMSNAAKLSVVAVVVVATVTTFLLSRGDAPRKTSASAHLPALAVAEAPPVLPPFEPPAFAATSTANGRNEVERFAAEPAPLVDATDPAPEPAAPATFVRHLTVVDHESRPVPDAEVTLRSELHGALELGTDAAGSVLLRHEPAEVQVDVWRAGVGMGRTQLAFAAATDGEAAQVRLLRPIAVHGIVLGADERPVPGALVSAALVGTLLSEETPYPPDDVVADADGRFDVRLHSLGSFHLSATHDGERTFEQPVNLSSGYEVDVTLRFLGAIAIEGTLLAPDGTPVAEGSVHVDETSWDVQSESRKVWEWRTTDADGRFVVLLPRHGTYELTGRARTGSPVALTVELDEVTPRRDVELELAPIVKTTGRVLWDDGSPVAACTLVAYSEDSTLLPKVALESGDPVRFGYVVGESRADGSFELAPLAEGTMYDVWFVPDLEQPLDRLLVEGVAAGSQGVEVVLSPASLTGAFVEGRLTSALGRDASGARVQVHWREKESTQPWGSDVELFWKCDLPRRTLTGDELWRELAVDNGRYRVDRLVAGRQIVLFVTAPGHGTELVGPFEASFEGTTHDVLLRSPRRLEVEIIDAAGLPASRAKVSLSYIGTVQLTTWYGERYADGDGKLVYEDVAPGPYELGGRDEFYGSSVRVEVQAGTPVTRAVLKLE